MKMRNPVVHKGTRSASSPGTGEIETKTYAQLSTLDAGYNFTLDAKHPFRGKRRRSPPAVDVFRRDCPDAIP